MRTPIGELPGPALAGGLALIAGIATWRLGIEFEQMWMRSYEGPLVGDTTGDDGERSQLRVQVGESGPARGDSRRWVTNHHPRAVTRATRVA